MNIQYLKTEDQIINSINTYYQQYDKIFIFTQKTILTHYQFINTLNAHIHICDENESCKSIAQYNKSIQYLHDHQCNKKSLILGIGGGTITDFSGYVAST